MRPSTPEHYRRIILTLAFLAVFIGSIPAFSVGTLAPLLRAALHLTREQLGWLTALFYAGTALVCIPAGWIADRFGLRFPLVAVQVAGGVALLATPFLHTYSALLLVMFLVGIAYGTVTVITAKAVSEWFPRTLRATALGVRLCALPVSGSLAGMMVPGLALWGGWRRAFAVFGGLMLVSAGSHLLLYRDCPQTAPPPASLPTAPSRRSVFRNRNIWLLAAAGFLFGGVRYSSTAYLALFLHEGWGIPLTQAASVLAQAHLASAPGFILYGFVSDRWLNGERKGLFCGLGAVAAAALLALLLLPQHTSAFVLVALIIVYGLSGLSWGSMYQALSVEVAGQGAAGIGIGITVSLMYAGTTATAPLFGYVADITESYALAWGLLILWLGLGIGCLTLVQTTPAPLQPNPAREVLAAWRSCVSKPSVPHRDTPADPPSHDIACRVERVAAIETGFQIGGIEMQSTMKALVKDGNTVAVKTVPQPRVQREDEVLIRVVLAGLCRTDVYVAEGRIVAPDPLLLGHEFAGVVAEVGAQVTGLKPGDRVAVNPALPCETCQLCVQGATADCQQITFLGVDRHGAFAEFIVVPARVIYRLPDTVSFLAGAYLEPVAASLAVLKAGLQPEAKGLIYGDNRIAQLTQKLLSAHGFHQVSVYDVRSHPGALAQNAYDYIIETLATTETLQHMVHALRPRGTIVLKSRQYQPVGFTLSEIMKKEPVLHVVNYGSFQEALALLATGRLTVDDLAGRFYSLDDYGAVFGDAQHSEARKPFFVLSDV